MVEVRTLTPSLNSDHIRFRTLSKPPFFLYAYKRLSIVVRCVVDNGSSSVLNFFRWMLSMLNAGLFKTVDSEPGGSSPGPAIPRSQGLELESNKKL